ncbi:SpoIIE family protein phosphatase [Streptomyces sp. PR69]|uniref:ATP-binding SpoIIE family protein phosphatase n=1 Tax=Streptomyces sp. PR69 TaxID=2984950 RepID=UPI002264705E|nr:SpoIIE family protein phosphatase [Streptomyces sp. PR69]
MSTVNPAEEVDVHGPLDVTRAATAVLDADGVIVGWSPAAERLLGYGPGEILGRPAAALLASRNAHGDVLADPAAEAAHRHRVLVLRHRDGHPLRIAAARLALAHHGAGPARLLALAAADETEQWEALQSMLKGLATQSPVGLAIYDTRLKVVWTNAALYEEMGPADYHGVGPDDMVTHGEILSARRTGTLEETMREVLATGEPVIELHYRGRPPVDPDRDHVWSCSYYRLQDAAGVTLGVCEETVDITDRYLAQQRLDLLVRAGGRVGTTLDMDRTARELCSVAVPGFADEAAVDVLAAVLDGELPPPGPVPATGLVRVWDTSGRTTSPPPAGRPPGRRHTAYPPDAPQARSLATGHHVLEHPGEGAEGAAGTLAATASLLAVPLRAEGVTLGVVTFTRTRHPDPFDTAELAVAHELVARTAVCLDNARRYTREHSAALLLQRSLLPRRLPRLTAAELAYRYLPADSKAGVGGDWFDVIPLSGTRVALVVGDVVGHGLTAAATMGRLRTSVRALAQLDLAPDELLARLDDLVVQIPDHLREAGEPRQPAPEEPTEDEAVGVTCLYAVYDPVSALCRMARAGHPPPAVVDPASGAVDFPDIPAGPPLGLGGLPFESMEMELPEGSVLALFTDGLVRGRGRDPAAGLDALRDTLADVAQPLETLCDRAVARLLPDGAVDDDAALLLVRTRILDRHQVAVWELAADPEVVGLARAEAGRQIREWGLDEHAFTTELVVSELVTNAIRYAGGPIQVRLIRDRTLICEVSDTGHTSPHLRRAGSEDEGGRGLFLIAQLTQQWGTRYTPTGKTIWAEQQL